jgi:hypothetical protein
MSTLTERIAKHIEKTEKANYSWYTLLVAEYDANSDESKQAYRETRVAMERAYHLSYASDAEELLGNTESVEKKRKDKKEEVKEEDNKVLKAHS